jgi:ribosome biogenesis GTPase
MATDAITAAGVVRTAGVVPPSDNRLAELGWAEPFASALAELETARAGSPGSAGFRPARVIAQDRVSYVVAVGDADLRATLSGRFWFDAGSDPESHPAVGDWVAVDDRPDGASIHALLPRRTTIRRRAALSELEVQVVGANVDVVFIVASLNRELNLRRLERYLAVGWESGAIPVVVLSKVDLVDDAEMAERLVEVEAVAVGVTVVGVSAVDGTGLDRLRTWIEPTRTIAFIGSSGVGKSTLINALAGSEQAAAADIRADDDRGRHTTTRRQLHRLADGGLLLDTPGMRELGLVDAGDGLDQTFDDIEGLAGDCRFRNCRHHGEPGCAVAAAIDDGRLDGKRLEAHRHLEREARHFRRKHDARLREEERRRWKSIGRSVQQHMEAKYGQGGW